MKTKTQHTPGPIAVLNAHVASVLEAWTNGGNLEQALLDLSLLYSEQAKLDKPVYDAAPDLLEAAKAAVKAMEADGYAWKHGVVELRAAIAKATEGR